MNTDDIIPMQFREAWAKFVPNGQKVTSNSVAREILDYLVYNDMGDEITEDQQD